MVMTFHIRNVDRSTVIQAVAIGQNFKIKILKERPEIIVGYIQGFQKMCGMRAFWSFMM